MPFGIISRTGPGMRQVVVGFGNPSTGRGIFGGKFGARHRHCNQWGLYGVVCDSAATRPSSQITLGRLVFINRLTILVKVDGTVVQLTRHESEIK